MSGRVVTWTPEMEPLGRAVVAIGVFDGVHLGHQALLSDAVAEAQRLDVISVALTFDRDPDQIVMPEAAAPQLLTLEDKSAFILETGIDIVLVVPFTEQIATTEPEAFLDDVLGACCEVATLHVGADFRFGARASGTVDTLAEWANSHGARVRPHLLLEIDGAPVTSTRVRRLIANGDVAAAAALLGRPTRVTGRVHRGRAQGAQLGFPTANLVPVPYAAVPADGVYAAIARLSDGSAWPAAVSVGVPPTFPEARDYVEAHLIGFGGDLYGDPLTLEFLDKLRDQEAYGSLGKLTDAIAADVARATEIATAALSAGPASGTTGSQSAGEGPAFELNPAVDIGHKLEHALGMDRDPEPYYLDDGTPIVENPEELARATAEAGRTRTDDYPEIAEDWVELVERRRLSSMFGEAGFTAALVTAPLRAAQIPFRWDPYPPEQMPGFRVGYGAIDRPFTLLVPASRLAEARELMDLGTVHRHTAPPTSDILMPPRGPSRPMSGPHTSPTGVSPDDPAQRDAAAPRLVTERTDAGSRFVRAAIWVIIISALIGYMYYIASLGGR